MAARSASFWQYTGTWPRPPASSSRARRWPTSTLRQPRLGANSMMPCEVSTAPGRPTPTPSRRAPARVTRADSAVTSSTSWWQATSGARSCSGTTIASSTSPCSEVLTTRMLSVPSSAPISARPRPAMRSGVGRRPSEPVTATPSSASQPSSSSSLVSRLTVDFVRPLRSASAARDWAGSSSSRRSSTLRLIDLTNRWSPVIGGLVILGVLRDARRVAAGRHCPVSPRRRIGENK